MKAPPRIQALKSLEPELPLSPQPINTRWRTWIKSVKYYAMNFGKILRVFDALDGEEATAIKISKDFLHDSTIVADIPFIASNYGFLEESIDKLESYGQPLHANIKIVTDIMNIITSVNDAAANPIKEKHSTVIDKNDGFKTLQNIS